MSAVELDLSLVMDAVRVTEAAAIASWSLAGRGDEKEADHDAAVDVEAVEGVAHGFDGGAIGLLLVPAAGESP